MHDDARYACTRQAANVFQMYLNKNDYAKFENVQIGETGELVWADQLDLGPDQGYDIGGRVEMARLAET